MSVMRNRPKGAPIALFGLGLCFFAVFPTETGYQDIASLLARQPGVAERWQKRVVASAVTSIQVATFSFGRPIGTGSRNPTFQLASFETSGDDITGALTRNPLMQAPRRYEASDFPSVDRTLKGDRLALHRPGSGPDEQPASDNSLDNNASVRGAKTVERLPVDTTPLDPELAAALQAPPLQQYDASLSLETQPLADLSSSGRSGPSTIFSSASRKSF